MKECNTSDRSIMAAIFLQQRYEDGLRDKVATGITAAIRMMFTAALEPTGFLDSAVLAAARTACRRDASELRELRNRGPSTTVKLPLCERMILGLRSKLWEGKGWGYPHIDSRAVYIAVVWAYDQDARVSEYTAPELRGEDHCIRVGDLSFEVVSTTGKTMVRGGELPFEEAARGCNGETYISACWVRASTHKCGSVVKSKMIGRRTPEEERFLLDLVEWLSHSGGRPEDRLFKRYATIRGKISARELRRKDVKEGITGACEDNDLNPIYFSTHSLRKASTSHMRAMGVSIDDRRDRGNYSANSEVLNEVYDYSTSGHGPLSANALGGGAAPGIDDIRRLLPRESRGSGKLSG